MSRTLSKLTDEFFFALKTVNIKFPDLFSFKLLTCNLYYNVHLFDGYVFEHNSECKYTHIYLINNISGKFFGPVRLWHGFGPGQGTGNAGRGFMNRILIVSDDSFLRDMVRLSLIGMRTEVRCAAGADGWKGFAARIVRSGDRAACGPFLAAATSLRSVRPAGLRRPLFTWCRGFSPNRPS